MKFFNVKTAIAAVCVVAAGFGGVKAYNAAAQSETDMLLAENVEALSSGDGSNAWEQVVRQLKEGKSGSDLIDVEVVVETGPCICRKKQPDYVPGLGYIQAVPIIYDHYVKTQVVKMSVSRALNSNAAEAYDCDKEKIPSGCEPV